jgi:D-3-phosphoglycerate dehydrogenase
LSKKPYIINTSRGGIIDTKELIVNLKKDRIKGAALDVLENEKLSSYTEDERNDYDFLATQDNVILTSHIAGYSFEAVFQLSNTLMQKIEPHLK